jgi:hypothetical protein
MTTKSHRLRNAVLIFAGVIVTAVVVTRPAVYLWLAAASLQVIEEVNELRTHPLDRCFTVYPCPNDI